MRSHCFVFIGGALGILAYKVDYSTTNFFKKSVESVEGFELIEQAFPAGLLFPTTLLIQSTDGPVTEEDVTTVSATVEEIDGVAATRPTGQTSDDESKTTVDVILDGDPFTKAAFNVVPEIRDSVGDLEGLTVLVGGGSAIQYDFDEAIESDLKLIAPIALLVIGLILGDPASRSSSRRWS